ncbi:hypothetical protein ACF0H5_009521 [Mactra antiquata]
MSDIDDGPKRRVSKGRRRLSRNEVTEDKDNVQNKKRTLSNEIQNEDLSDTTVNNMVINDVDNFHYKDFVASTPVSKRRRSNSADNDIMNKSDAMLAELDIDTLTSQAFIQSGTNHVISTDKYSHMKKDSSESKLDNGGSVVKHDNANAKHVTVKSQLDESDIITSPTESQYFVSKFRRYKPSQPVQRKEIVLDNSFNVSRHRPDTKSQCNVLHIHDTEILTVSLNDSTCKGNCVSKQSDRSIHGVSNVVSMSSTGDCSQLSLSDDTFSDVTQLKDNDGFKYRCTPFRHKTQEFSGMTQTQCQLMAGTQYKTYIHDTIQTQSQAIPCDRMDSQIQSSVMYHMTGALLETQNNVAENDGNMSGCDLFNDSLIERSCPAVIGPGGDVVDNKLTKPVDEVVSNTQSLLYCDNDGKTQTRRDSFDEDLDCISQESQNLREKSLLSKKSTVLSCNTDDKVPLNANNDVTESGNTNIDKNSSKNAIKGEKSEALTTKLSESTGKDIDKRKDKTSESITGCTKFKSVVSVPVGTDILQGKSKQTETKTEINENSNSSKAGSLRTVLGTNSVNTSIGPGTLQERIKKRLQENVGQTTSERPGSMMERLREQVLERVQLEAVLARQQTFNDVGPFYGLPSKVQHLFENYHGIKTLYDWQDECLKLEAIKQRTNLIYSLPTSGGKTLVAEILILRELLCNKRDALFILPFVSIVQEKVRNMSQFAIDLNFYVEEYAGSKGRFPPIKRRHNRSLYIATIEKAHSIINSLIETDRMDDLGLVVVDELHMLGEGGSRGSILESTLLKILYTQSPTHIIGMSATLNNIKDLCTFLKAEVYCNDFRPVTLTEYVKLTDNIYKVDSKALLPDDLFIHDRVVYFQYRPEMNKVDPDHLLGLILEVIPEKSCLVFCPTKKNCENVALMLCKLMSKYKRELTEVKRSERKQLLKELYNDSEGKMCPILQYTLHYGIAYHHSGLTSDERKLIEESYSAGILCLLTCTSTLAAGVNLPAKRVILRSPYVGQCFISRSQYKQMIGRAGRAGIDDSGESILICKSTDREKVSSLIQGPIENCHSSLLYNSGKGLQTLLLSLIALRITPTTDDIFKFVTSSLAKIQESVLKVDITEICKTSLQKLIDIGLVLQVKVPSENPQQAICCNLEVTRLGKATFKGPIDSDYAVMLYNDLKKAEDSLVIATHLHLLYLVTPYDLVKDIQPSWYIYFNQMSLLTSSEMKVATLIGVQESYVAKRASQQKSKQKVDELVIKRFYLTLMLYDLWKEKSVWDVAEKYQQTRGFIQTLLSSAATFAACVSHFCDELEEFWAYQELMGNFVKRLSYCVTAELLPLMEIPGVKLGRARLLYTAGYQTLGAVATSQPKDLVKNVQYMPYKVARQIIASAKLMLNDKADAMIEEVEALVRVPDAQKGTNILNNDKTPVPVTPVFSDSQDI